MRTALEAFQIASQKSAAYQKFLHAHNIDPASILNEKDFFTLPLTSKESYILKYPFYELLQEKKRPPVAYASSGSSGTPTFWFGSDEYEERGARIHEKIFREIFRIDKEQATLVVICFSMGVWVAGSYTLASCRRMAANGWNVTSITPGIEKEDIMHILRTLAPHFQNVVLVGYPPFIMDVITEAQKRDVKFTSSIRILTSGDKFSEQWRDDILYFLQINSPYTSLIGIYGCADAAVLGYETPLSIFLRRNVSGNEELQDEIYPQATPSFPAIVQYDPAYVYFEEQNNELILTTNAPIPLVRYNIHDTGRVLPFENAVKLLEKHGLWEEASKHGFGNWMLPFLVLSGRTDVAVTFYALNIPGDHLKFCVEDQRIKIFLSGNFFAYTKDTDTSREQKLFINVELRGDVKKSKKIQKIVQEVILENLLKLNIEYRKLHSTLGEKSLPLITLFSFGDEKRHVNNKGLARLRGNKLRLVR